MRHITNQFESLDKLVFNVQDFGELNKLVGSITGAKDGGTGVMKVEIHFSVSFAVAYKCTWCRSVQMDLRNTGVQLYANALRTLGRL